MDRTGRRPARSLALGAGSVVVAGALALWLTGVGGSTLARYAGYELVYVLAPGLAAYLALAARPGGPVQVLTFGWTVGLAIEVAAFIVTGAAGIPTMFTFYPLLVLAVAVPAAWRRAGAVDWTDIPSPGAVAVGSAVIIVAIAYLAVGPFIDSPLPERAPSVAYYVDSVFDISLVGEAIHHWPLQNPSVAGEPLRYHLFSFLDMGGTARVTGVEPATLVLRLFPLSMTLLSFLNMCCLGRRVGGRWAVGVLAGALLFLTGELDLDPRDMFPFAGTFAFATYASPTFLFALPPFLGAATLLCDVLERDERPTGGDMTVLGLLVVLGVGAKASAVPVLLGGLVLVGIWCLARRRDRVRRVAVVAAALGAVFLVAYAALYSGGGEALRLQAFEFLRITVTGDLVPEWRDNVLIAALLTPPTIVISWIALIGVAWLWPLSRAPLSILFLLALLLASMVPFVVVSSPGLGQLYFLLYGLPAAVAAGAVGLDRAWRRAAERGVRAPSLVIAAAVVIAVAAAAGTWVWERPEGSTHGVLLAAYGATLLVVAACSLAVTGRRGLPALAAVAGTLLVAAAAVDRPLDILPRHLQARADGVPSHPLDTPSARGTTLDLTRGLRWVRDHTPADALLAVNVHFRDALNQDSRYFYYSALTERRVFLESWSYTPQGAAVDAPPSVFPERQRINDGAILRGDPGDLRALRERGVDYVLVDRTHGAAASSLEASLDAVFRNRALTVYRL